MIYVLLGFHMLVQQQVLPPLVLHLKLALLVRHRQPLPLNHQVLVAQHQPLHLNLQALVAQHHLAPVAQHHLVLVAQHHLALVAQHHLALVAQHHLVLVHHLAQDHHLVLEHHLAQAVEQLLVIKDQPLHQALDHLAAQVVAKQQQQLQLQNQDLQAQEHHLVLEHRLTAQVDKRQLVQQVYQVLLILLITNQVLDLIC